MARLRSTRAVHLVALGACAAALGLGAAPASAQVTFSGPTNFGVGDFPSLLAVADFNADKKLDIVTANQHSDDVSILLGDGAGGFSAPSNFGAGGIPQMVAVGDFNADGRPDLAVPNLGSENVSILLGDGAGGFSAPRNFTAGHHPVHVAVADLNADGPLDLAVANQGSDNVSILLGDGAGGFSGPTNFAAAPVPNTVEVGNFNLDAWPDLAVVNRGPCEGGAGCGQQGRVSILLGAGAGRFTAPNNIVTGNLTFTVAIGDFNSDHLPDLAVDNFFDEAKILRGNGKGGFSFGAHFPAGSGPNSVAAADFDRDARRDLAFTNFNLDGSGRSNVAIFLGTGLGGFSGAGSFPTNEFSNNVKVGDFNGDTKPDLAVANLQSNDVSILLNTTGPASSYRDLVMGDQPRGYWRLGDTSRASALDSSGFANHGSYRGGPTLGLSGALATDPDKAVGMDGSDDFVRIPDSPSLHTGDHFSLELWIKRRSRITQVKGLFLKGYQLYLDGNGQVVLGKPKSREIARSRTRITDTTQFHHVVATKSGAAAHIYIDGLDVTGTVAKATIEDTSNTLSIGAGANTFPGVLDEAAVYDYALTPSQVIRHHDAGGLP